MKRYVMVVAMVLGFGSLAHADVTFSGTQVTATMTEPTMNVTNSDGLVTPLTDLEKTRVTYQLPGGGEELCGEYIPATSPSGGGEVSTTCVVPVVPNSESDVTFRGYAIDTSGNESDPTPNLIIRIDSLRSAPPAF